MVAFCTNILQMFAPAAYEPSMFCNLRRAIQYMIGDPDWAKYTISILGEANGPICPEECPSDFYSALSFYRLCQLRPAHNHHCEPNRFCAFTTVPAHSMQQKEKIQIYKHVCMLHARTALTCLHIVISTAEIKLSLAQPYYWNYARSVARLGASLVGSKGPSCLPRLGFGCACRHPLEWILSMFAPTR